MEGLGAHRRSLPCQRQPLAGPAGKYAALFHPDRQHLRPGARSGLAVEHDSRRRRRLGIAKPRGAPSIPGSPPRNRAVRRGAAFCAPAQRRFWPGLASAGLFDCSPGAAAAPGEAQWLAVQALSRLDRLQGQADVFAGRWAAVSASRAIAANRLPPLSSWRAPRCGAGRGGSVRSGLDRGGGWKAKCFGPARRTSGDQTLVEGAAALFHCSQTVAFGASAIPRRAARR